MNNLYSLVIILTAGLLFSCKSQSGDELLLRGIMKNRMGNHNYTKYTESKNGDTLKFEVADKVFCLKGNPAEYTEGQSKFSITVEKAGDGTISKVKFNKDIGISSGYYLFEVKDTGVMVKTFLGE
jgi:hypothetical protein